MIKSLSTKLFELGTKKRKLREEINVVQIEYDSKKKQMEGLNSAATDLHESIKVLSLELEAINKLGEESVQFAVKSTSEALDVLRALALVVEDGVKIVKQANEKVEERKKEIQSFDEDFAQKNENILNENKRLSVLKSDLDIYKERLQKKYNEMDLGDLIL